MKKQVLLYIICVCSLFNLIAQDKLLSDRLKNDILKVRQIPMSEEAVKSYFKGMKGIVYATIYPAANCPRCEAAINSQYRELKRLSKDNQTVLITVYNDSVLAKSYNKDKGYKADRYIYDTEKKYRNFLSFSFGDLHIVYMLKIDVDRGIVMLGLSSDDGTPEFMSEFAGYTGEMKQKKFKQPHDFKNTIKPKSKEFYTVSKIFKIETPKESPISHIYEKTYFEGNNLVLNDKLKNSIFLLKLNENNSTLHFYKEIISDSVENKKYCTVPHWYYEQEKRSGGLYFIPLSPVITNGEIWVSYSLPDLWVIKEIDGEPASVGYQNQPCIIFRDINGNKLRDVVAIKYSKDDYWDAHFTFGVSDSVIVLPCKKRTWPLGFEKEEYQDKPSMNPFDSKFYDEDNYIFKAIDSRTGQTKEYFGDLEEIHRKTLTGYYFTSPVFDSYNDKAVYTDGVSGTIHLVKTDKLDETIGIYKAYSVDTKMFPEPNPANFYSYESVNPYLELLSREIYDIRLSKDKIHCIIKYGTHNDDWEDLTFTYVEIDMKSGNSHEYLLPKHKDALKYGLWRKGYNVKPYIISRDKVLVFENK